MLTIWLMASPSKKSVFSALSTAGEVELERKAKNA